ncbi:MAG: DUF2628 domain-containing protein [Clostridia bacterium]|nr:DUF2628 domain-containing protein [Clostridia bacterium]
MAFEDKKIKCAYCGAYLFEDDDIVFCPDCGAPHHRECYNEKGSCALSDSHGTNEQYDAGNNGAYIKPDNSNTERKEQVKCMMCGTVYDKDDRACPTCGTPRGAGFNRGPFAFDFLGGVPADMDLGEGVTADEAKRFVFSNTPRYIPKFAANKMGKKSSFNWFAFLFPGAWMLSRKMYIWGAVLTALQIAFALLLLPFMMSVNSFLPDDISSYNEIYNIVSQNFDKIGFAVTVVAFISTILNFATHIVFGILGDYIYRNHVIKTVSQIKNESEDIDEDMRRKGGVSFFLFIIGILAVEFLPNIIYSFI